MSARDGRSGTGLLQLEAASLREVAGSRVRYGYRRLTVLLRREGWVVNAKRVYRLYQQEGLQVRSAANQSEYPVKGSLTPGKNARP